MADLTPKQLTDIRHNTHGDWMYQSGVTHNLKRMLREEGNWEMLLPHHREALDMIAVKMGRILTGDPKFADHWDDIAGYAHLGKAGHNDD